MPAPLGARPDRERRIRPRPPSSSVHGCASPPPHPRRRLRVRRQSRTPMARVPRLGYHRQPWGPSRAPTSSTSPTSPAWASPTTSWPFSRGSSTTSSTSTRSSPSLDTDAHPADGPDDRAGEHPPRGRRAPVAHGRRGARERSRAPGRLRGRARHHRRRVGGRRAGSRPDPAGRPRDVRAPAGRRGLLPRAGRRPPRRRPRRGTAPSTPGWSSTTPAPSRPPTRPMRGSPRPGARDHAALAALHPLCGVPVGLKDLVTQRGAQCTAGSRILAGYVAPFDAHVTERLRDAGAVIMGKLNMDEFAMGSSTEHSAYGPTSNPWDLDRVPGGSSGGSRGVGGRVPRAAGHRHRHRRLDPPARGDVRDRRAQAHLRPRQPLRDRRLRELARPGRAAGARDARRRPAPARRRRPRRARLHLGPASRPARAARPCRRRTTRPPRRCAASGWACPASTSWPAWSRAWRRGCARPSRRWRRPAPRSWT